MSYSLQLQGLYSPWNSPGQNTRAGSLSLLQGIFPTQGSNPGLSSCRRILYQLSHQGSPRRLEWVAYSFSSGSSRPRNTTCHNRPCRQPEAPGVHPRAITGSERAQAGKQQHRLKASFHPYFLSLSQRQWLSGKESTCKRRIPASEGSPAGGSGNPLQCSCLEKPMDRGAWRETVHGVTKSQTRLSTHT